MVLEAISEDSEDSKAFRGLFSAKCYPFPDGKEFSGFSFLERKLVGSDFFDTTNTPKFEHRAAIPSALFIVGAVELAINEEDEWSVLTLESQELIRARYEIETPEDYPLVESKHLFRAGDVGRQIPGWDISYLFFDRLVCLWAHYTKIKPLKVVLEKVPGFEYVYRDSGWACDETSETKVNTLSVLFGASPAEDKIKSIPGGRTSTPGANVIDLTCPQCSGHGKDNSGYVNRLWWTIAETDFKSELSSTCGCD